MDGHAGTMPEPRNNGTDGGWDIETNGWTIMKDRRKSKIIEENQSEWRRRKGMGFPKDEMIFSYETCLTARSHSSDVKRTLVSQDWIPRKPSVLTSGFYQTRHLRASYGYLFFKMASSLDAFSSYPLPRGYSACLVRQLIN